MRRGQACYRAGGSSPCYYFAGGVHDFSVECVKKPTDNNTSLCFATAAPGPVLRDLCTGPGTDEARSPTGITKGIGVACEPRFTLGPPAENTTRARLGIAWAETWPSPRIVRMCCNPDTVLRPCAARNLLHSQDFVPVPATDLSDAFMHRRNAAPPLPDGCALILRAVANSHTGP